MHKASKFQRKGPKGPKGPRGPKGHNNNARASNYWNDNLVSYLSTRLAPTSKKPFSPFSQSPTQVVIDSHGQIASSDDCKALPNYLVNEWEIDSAWVESCYIYQVDTVYSLWHSILSLIYPEYLLLDFDGRRTAVAKFRSVVNNDFINDSALREQIKKIGLHLTHVNNSIQQEKIQDAVLLKFLSLYFDMNIYLVSDKKLEFYHWEPKLNAFKSGILLYRHPFGNLAPIFNNSPDRDRSKHRLILSYAKSPEFVQQIAKKIKCSGPISVSDQQDGENGENGESEKVQTPHVVVVSKKSGQKAKPSVKTDWDTFESNLKKLKWDELAEFAHREEIDSMQPSARGGQKKKTKATLIREIWEKTK